MLSPQAALKVVSEAVATQTARFTPHFDQRLTQRALLLSDVQLALDECRGIRSDGIDDFGQERWFFRGPTALGPSIEILATVSVRADNVLLVTLYWL
jgi:hypothetical protein